MNTNEISAAMCDAAEVADAYSPERMIPKKPNPAYFFGGEELRQAVINSLVPTEEDVARARRDLEPVPPALTQLQLRRWLLLSAGLDNSGLVALLNRAEVTDQARALLQIDLQYSAEFTRNSQLIATLFGLLGKGRSATDEAFRSAVKP